MGGAVHVIDGSIRAACDCAQVHYIILNWAGTGLLGEERFGPLGHVGA